MFYDYEMMTITQWFDMLSDDSRRNDNPTHIYKLTAHEDFKADGHLKEAGIYYTRTVKENIEDFVPFCTIHKLSFSELVYLSDVFSWVVSAALPKDDMLRDLVEKGEAATFFDREIVSTQGLENLKKKVKLKYFDESLKGTVRRVFSSLINFFRKYNLFIETGIHWPGDSCDYADKVIAKIDRIKRIFLQSAFQPAKRTCVIILKFQAKNLQRKHQENSKKFINGKFTNLTQQKFPEMLR